MIPKELANRTHNRGKLIWIMDQDAAPCNLVLADEYGIYVSGGVYDVDGIDLFMEEQEADDGRY